MHSLAMAWGRLRTRNSKLQEVYSTMEEHRAMQTEPHSLQKKRQGRRGRRGRSGAQIFSQVESPHSDTVASCPGPVRSDWDDLVPLE